MLILTRRPGESIMIETNDSVSQEELRQEGDSIEVTGENDALIVIKVLRVKGGQISLGITAGHKHKIYREEIYHKQKKQDYDVGSTEYDPGYVSEDVENDDYY